MTLEEGEKKMGEGKKYTERPSTRKVILYCETCNSSDEHFMTNAEISNRAIRLVWCNVCGKMTKRSMNLKERTAAQKLVLERLKQVPDDARLCNI